MARSLVLVVPLSLLLLPALAAGQKQKEKEPDKPPAHVILQAELLQEEQALYRLQTEWLLHLLKYKQQLERDGTAPAKQEAVTCAKLLDAARDLPELYDDAVLRLKQPSLASLPVIKDALKATRGLSDGLGRVQEAMQKAPPESFAAERALGPKEVVLGFALFEAGDEINRTGRCLNGIETSADPMAAHASAVTCLRAVQSGKKTCAAALTAYGKRSQDRAFEGLLQELKELVEEKGPFARAEVALADLTAMPQGVFNIKLGDQARSELGELKSGLARLHDATVRLVIVGGPSELAQRQRRLHDRLKKHHDQFFDQLLETVEKSPG
jgi:hypothetical protein